MPDRAEQPSERESVQSAMNSVRQMMFGNGSTLTGLAKGEAERGIVADYLNRLDQAIDASLLAAADRERVLKEALERWAIPTMTRQMGSDDATDAPFNEDMAQAIAACYRALGDTSRAEVWYRDG